MLKLYNFLQMLDCFDQYSGVGGISYSFRFTLVRLLLRNMVLLVRLALVVQYSLQTILQM
jgi:hypothetical protein